MGALRQFSPGFDGTYKLKSIPSKVHSWRTLVYEFLRLRFPGRCVPLRVHDDVQLRSGIGIPQENRVVRIDQRDRFGDRQAHPDPKGGTGYSASRRKYAVEWNKQNSRTFLSTTRISISPRQRSGHVSQRTPGSLGISHVAVERRANTFPDELSRGRKG